MAVDTDGKAKTYGCYQFAMWLFDNASGATDAEKRKNAVGNMGNQIARFNKYEVEQCLSHIASN